MEFRAKDIAELLQGSVEGDANAVVNNVSKIEEGRPGTLAFLANPKYEHYLYETQASVVLVNKDFVPAHAVTATLIRVESAYDAIATLLQMYEEMRLKPIGIEQPSFVHESATIGDKIYIGAFAYIGKNVQIGKNVKIYPHAYIGDGVKIGDDCTIFSGVKIYHGCVLGQRCTIHAGTVIGADGFGFAPKNGVYNKIPQIGNVVLEDDVEIGANSCIDRATMGSTIVKQGVKLDNLIQIAHNVVIGSNSVIAAQTGVAGSSKVGANCMIGGQVGMVGHIEIGDETMVAAQTGITHTCPAKSALRGSPAFDINKFQKSYVLFRKLPDIWSQIGKLEQEIKTLKSK